MKLLIPVVMEEAILERGRIDALDRYCEACDLSTIGLRPIVNHPLSFVFSSVN